MPIPSGITTVSRAAMRDEVYPLLLNRIVDGTYEPGQRLDDDELAAEFGTSVGPLREALSRLAAQHMVEVLPRRGTIVSPIDPLHLRQAAATVYGALEQAIFTSTRSLTDDDRRALRRYRDTVLVHPALARDAVRTARVWDEMYVVFVRRHGNPEFARLLGIVGPYVRRFNHLYADVVDIAAERSYEKAEVDAALAGDRDSAMAAFRAHTRVILDAVVPTVEGRTGVRGPEPTSLAAVATSVVGAAICDGTLLPGEWLPEGELITWLGMSRTPIRDALRRLAEQGLVTLEHGRPARVGILDQRTARASADALCGLRLTAARIVLATDPGRVAAEMRRRLTDARAQSDPRERLVRVTHVTEAIDDALPDGPLRGLLVNLRARCLWFLRSHPDVTAPMTPDRVGPLVAAMARGDERAVLRELVILMDVDPSQVAVLH